MTSGPTTQQIVATCVQSYCLGPSASPQNIATAQQPQDIDRDENDRIAINVAFPKNSNYFITNPFYSITEGNETVVCHGGSVASTANTTQFWTIPGRPTVDTTEDNVKIKVRIPGRFSKLSVRLPGYSVNGTTDLIFRKNNADTILKVTTDNVNGAKNVDDVVNYIDVVDGDFISLKTVPGGATGTFTLGQANVNFAPADGSVCQLFAATRATTFTSNNVTAYMSYALDCLNHNSEGDSKARQKLAGVYKYFYVLVTANARTSTTTFRSRKNGANGNLVISVAAGTTGIFEDSANQDNVAAEDDYNFSVSNGAGSSEAITWTVVSVHFFPSPVLGGMFSTGGSSSSILAGTTKYMMAGGSCGNNTSTATEFNRILKTPIVVKKMVVNVQANSMTSDSTWVLVKNGTDSTITGTIVQGVIGRTEDVTHNETINPGDDIKYKFVAGATGTSFTVTNIQLYYDIPRVTSESILKWNTLARVSLERILKWNTLGRVSKELILKWNTLLRVSLERILKWNTTTRVSLEQILKWNTLGRVSLEQILKWNTLARVSLERILKWNTTTRVSKELTLLWNTLSRVSLERILKWNTLARVSLESILKWNTLSRVSKELILQWNTLQRVSKETILLWNILVDTTTRVSAEFILQWNTLGRVSKESILKWNTTQRVSKEVILLWNTCLRVSKETILLWNSLARISKEAILKWNSTSRVSLERILKWNTNNRVSNEFILKWNTLQRVSKEVIISWVTRTLRELKPPFDLKKGIFQAKDKIPRLGSFMRSLYNRNQDDI